MSGRVGLNSSFLAHDQINAGKYSDVRTNRTCVEILKSCDEGLIMGAPVDGFSIHDVVAATRPGYKPSINCSIEQNAPLPTLEEWINIRIAGKPVLISQGASSLAVEKLSFEFLWEKLKPFYFHHAEQMSTNAFCSRKIEHAVFVDFILRNNGRVY